MAITAAGGYSVRSGTTVLFELNSSGISGGGTTLQQWSINTSGQMTGIKQQVSVRTTAVSYTVTSSESGTLFVNGNNDGTSVIATLPRNPAAGVYYEFFVSTNTGADGFSIHSTADSSADIVLPGLTSAASTHQGLQPLGVGAHAVRLTALSSVRWFAQPIGQMNADSTISVSLAAYGWTSATTVA